MPANPFVDVSLMVTVVDPPDLTLAVLDVEAIWKSPVVVPVLVVPAGDTRFHFVMKL